ncbi:MAG TPA: multicopper oxidase domain-containing protein [Thermoanaerobaculia bacterium]|jgi:FtsP/CotA-like multicopper oxidase with cupredoxin domain|nr:multicopper oxidase domain-containing protein [Thermoanaerobaculia bacterium]
MIGKVTALLLLAAASAQAQSQFCIPCTLGQDLVEPPVISAVNGVLDTTLRIEMKPHSVPVWTQSGGQWSCCQRNLSLRTYGFPAPGGGYQWDFPGPTLKLRKPNASGGQGDRLRVKLVNALPVNSAATHECNACTGCDGANPPKCCDALDAFPNCFHGNDDTNLHFHGSHVSPQAPQDYVLLELRPQGSSSAGSGTHGRGLVATGEYQYSVDPLRWTQPEGTHWYHPHKHGAVALQVANGMAGALLIEGPFDDWLRGFYQVRGFTLKEKLLVIQQVSDHLNFFQGGSAPTPLVNGQANPKVRMYPGEIQRWRFLGATMQGSAQLELDFNGPQGTPTTARQIAMDGIQFAPKNYERQPLLPLSLEFRLSPGNRADFLVQAPQTPGTYAVTYDVFGQAESSEQSERLRSLLEFLAPGAAKPEIVTIEVVPCSSDGACDPMPYPTPGQWPAVPSYLEDITQVAGTRTLRFELKDPTNGHDVSPPFQPSKFYINLQAGELRQYNPACVDITARLGTAEEWTIINTTDADPFHVFHIHTNSFQIIQNGTTPLDPPWVWRDSITLPANGNDSDLPKVVKMRTRFEEFTGEYVLHCHFLGHEDRGMMLGVQTVCPTLTPSLYFGKPNPTGPECFAGNYIPAAPQCPVITTQ